MNFRIVAGFVVATGLLSACGSKSASEGSTKVQGEIRIDGSSTVYPITEAAAEEFRLEQPDVRITVGVSGTGGGFKKFCRGEIDINNASRPIKAQEAAVCNEGAIQHIALKVAFDGLAIVVNKENTWADKLTVEELKKIWEPSAQGKVTRWNQIRPEWPADEFHLYGPGVASGTYDYFTEAVVGQSGASRGDFTASEDDNVLVQGVAGDKNGLAFFGLAYYEENREQLKLVPVDNGKGPVLPSVETIKDGTYSPLARAVYLYVSDKAASREEVRSFVQFYLNNAEVLVPDVGYIPLSSEEYQAQQAAFEKFTVPR
ncbi:MAG TPA: PstS family phosphate ABC transporter substrate-binding protein [Ohtaekwangia sp.]|nr:PstS family phosphate ABC transporter substrate-binding protein [Ohtaekwangia sp.]